MRFKATLSTLLLASSVAMGASFDCSTARTFVETSVCNNELLSALDQQLYDSYMEILNRTDFSPDTAGFYKSHYARLTTCTDVVCLISRYQDSLRDLKRIATEKQVPLTSLSMDRVPDGAEEHFDPDLIPEASIHEDPEVYSLKTQCAAKNYLACDSVSLYYRHGNKVEKDITASLVWGEISCAFGSPKACGLIGAGYYYGAPELGFRRDNVLAFRYLKRACDLLHDERACDVIGQAYMEGRILRKQPQKAIAYHRKSCEYGKEKRCTFAEIATECSKYDPSACFLYRQATNHLRLSFDYLQTKDFEELVASDLRPTPAVD
ncbi:MAG: hypothetical protein K6A65_00650 [Succinivibrionaceae bacterium]|nr:hypothetical protein [Succinivibrionaceae bacterium]